MPKLSKTRERISIGVRPSTKKALELILARDEMTGGQVLDSLLERWVFENDTGLASEAGMKEHKVNRFASPSQTIRFASPSQTISYPIVDYASGSRAQRPDGQVIPPSQMIVEPAPNAEVEVPPSKRARST